MDKFKKVKVIGNVIGFNIDASGKETYNVQFPDMTVAELESYQFEEADAYCANEKPLCLRNVLARLRELPEHDREVWMDEIMHEFANDYGSVKYTLGYEQGKFDGAVEAEKSNKVVIPQFVAKWLKYCKNTHVDLNHALTVGDVYFYNYANQLGRKEGKVCIRQFVSQTWQMNCSNQLTEAEIKQDFDWAWQWAKPMEVQEVEE